MGLPPSPPARQQRKKQLGRLPQQREVLLSPLPPPAVQQQRAAAAQHGKQPGSIVHRGSRAESQTDPSTPYSGVFAPPSDDDADVHPEGSWEPYGKARKVSTCRKHACGSSHERSCWSDLPKHTLVLNHPLVPAWRHLGCPTLRPWSAACTQAAARGGGMPTGQHGWGGVVHAAQAAHPRKARQARVRGD